MKDHRSIHQPAEQLLAGFVAQQDGGQLCADAAPQRGKQEGALGYASSATARLRLVVGEQGEGGEFKRRQPDQRKSGQA